MSRSLTSLLPLVVVAAACSLEGLADGSGAGGLGGAAASSSSSSGGSDGVGGVGGAGGAPTSAFTWLATIGNELVQGTSPYATDAGSGSTLRMSVPGPSGEVWVAVATKGALDPDGAGPLPSRGSTDSANLFVLEIAPGGAVTAFGALEGDLESIEEPLSVGAVVRVAGDAVAVVGTFRAGTLDLGAIGQLTNTSQSQDDGFVVRFDAAAVPTHARQLGGGNVQTARAATVHEGALLVAGKLKRVLAVTDPDGVADAACAFSQNMEEFERVLVAALDPADLKCTHRVLFAATDVNAAQQAWAIAADASGVYVAGSYTRQLIADPLPSMPASASEDGFIVALDPDLTPATTRWVARATSNRNSGVDALRAAALSGGRLWVGGYLDRGTTAVMSAEPSIETLDAVADNDCILTLPDVRDGLVGALDPQDGTCLGAALLGTAQGDEVRGLAPSPGGVVATGFTTAGVMELDASLAGGSRDGFAAFLSIGTGAEIDGGWVLGGVSWDYLDAAQVTGSEVVLAGTFDASFDFLTGGADFWIGSRPVP